MNHPLLCGAAVSVALLASGFTGQPMVALVVIAAIALVGAVSFPWKGLATGFAIIGTLVGWMVAAVLFPPAAIAASFAGFFLLVGAGIQAVLRKPQGAVP